jgi:hypothetical protein
MPEREPVALDERRALTTLDTHFGLQLRCGASDLRRAGWTLVPAPAEHDPLGLLFGHRTLLTLLATRPADGAESTSHHTPGGGVAMIAPEVRPVLSTLLGAWTAETLFSSEGRLALDRVLRSAVPQLLTTPHEAHLHIQYAIPGGFRPYLGQWLDWIEALDENAEMDPGALSLLARYSGGVYVIRDGGTVVAFAGVRPQSPTVWELRARTIPEALRGLGMGRAVTSRATRAAFAAGRLPLYSHQAHDTASEHLVSGLGYRLYAEALVYTAPLS